MKFGLKNTVIEKIGKVFSNHEGIEKVVVYGSRAIGNYRNGSDIDLTIMGDIPWGLLSKINWELDDLLLPYMIDLSRFEDINNSNLIDHINRRGKIFYEREKVAQ